MKKNFLPETRNLLLDTQNPPPITYFPKGGGRASKKQFRAVETVEARFTSPPILRRGAFGLPGSTQPLERTP